MMRTAYGAGAAAGHLAVIMLVVLLLPFVAALIGLVWLLETLGVPNDVAQAVVIFGLPAGIVILLLLVVVIDGIRHRRAGHVKCPSCGQWFFDYPEPSTDRPRTYYRDLHWRFDHKPQQS